MTTFALAHPYMTGALALFALVAAEQAFVNLLRTILFLRGK